jgi:small subunit ribosomal protein S17
MSTEKIKIDRTEIGIVVSDKMNKTRTVLVERKVADPLYGKYVTKSKKFKAHDEENVSKTGDRVLIKEFRPISKTKSWMLVEILKNANQA